MPRRSQQRGHRQGKGLGAGFWLRERLGPPVLVGDQRLWWALRERIAVDRRSLGSRRGCGPHIRVRTRPGCSALLVARPRAGQRPRPRRAWSAVRKRWCRLGSERLPPIRRNPRLVPPLRSRSDRVGRARRRAPAAAGHGRSRAGQHRSSLATWSCRGSQPPAGRYPGQLQQMSWTRSDDISGGGHRPVRSRIPCHSISASSSSARPSGSSATEQRPTRLDRLRFHTTPKSCVGADSVCETT